LVIAYRTQPLKSALAHSGRWFCCASAAIAW
jgi:hypothetical protein